MCYRLTGPLYVLGVLIIVIGLFSGAICLGKEQWILGISTIFSSVFAGFLLLALGEITKSLKNIIKFLAPEDTEEEVEEEPEEGEREE